MAFYSLLTPLLNNFKGCVVSVIGGGGKSSLLQKLGRELVDQNLKVVLTTTTKIEQLPNIGLVLLEGNENFKAELNFMLHDLKIVLAAKKRYSENSLLGMDPLSIRKFKKYADVVLVKADGSKQRPFKTHAEHEPNIPPVSDMVIMVIGADAIHKPLDDKTVHRAELFSKKWKMDLGAKLTRKIIAMELLSPEGYLRNVPIGSRISIFINKTDLNFDGARSLASYLTKKCDHPVFWGSIKENSILETNKTTEGF